jgi:DNA-binding response OmpR family regulator
VGSSWGSAPGATRGGRVGRAYRGGERVEPLRVVALGCRAVPEVLLATDADWIHDEVEAALDGEHTIRRVRRGADVRTAVEERPPALVVLDLQIGNMGGMAACMDLRLEAGAGRIPDLPVLMLLDREADVFLARRSDADGWLVKPLDAFRLRRAAVALLAGGDYVEGVPGEAVEAVAAANAAETAEVEAVEA